MSDLFKTRMNNLFSSPSDINNTLSVRTINNSKAIEMATFTNDPNYKRGMLYDWNLAPLEEVDFKFQKQKTYTIEKDQVEYIIQFRPGFNPEKKFLNKYHKNDGKERLGFYIDVTDSITGIPEKWLIIGKDDRNYFDKYNVLKCNWVFEWLDRDKNYRTCLGCIRDRNSYNSGVWSDGFTTTVQNQTAFIVPTTLATSSIDYDIRFMICDNIKYPKVYTVSKIMDTFPLGVSKIVLTQAHYNAHADFYGTDKDLINMKTLLPSPLPNLPKEFGGEYHMICDCIKSKLPTIIENPSGGTESVHWNLSNVPEKLYIHGQPQIIKAIPNIETSESCEWRVFIDGTEYKIQDLSQYFDITIDKNNFIIAANNKVMAKYIIKISIYDSSNICHDSVEMEVCV